MSSWVGIYPLRISVDIAEYSEIVLPLITVVGWLILFRLGLRQQKANLRNEVAMKIYTEIFEHKKMVDDKSIALSVLLMETCPPFSLMEGNDIGNIRSVALKKANEDWASFTKSILDGRTDFISSYLKLWTYIEAWLTMMPELTKATTILFEERNRLSKRVYGYYNSLTKYSIEEYDWHKWDKEAIKELSNGLSRDFTRVTGGYMDDFMGLVHDALIADIVGHRRGIRRISGAKEGARISVLSKDGIVEHECMSKKE